MWVRLDDSYWSHPKVVGVGNEAAGVYARLLSYCGRHETDGRVPEEVARFISGKRPPLNKLLESGLVESNGAGFVIPDFLDFNPSHSALEEKRERDRIRKASG